MTNLLKNKRIEAIDLFCGVGGLTAGLLEAGIKVVAGYDIESSCQYPYEHNNKVPFVLQDVNSVTKDDLNAHYSSGSIKLLAGCAPCQPFSSYNQGKDTRKDKKWPLLYSFARLIEEVEPDLVTMENVPDVTKHIVYLDFVKKLSKLGYYIWANTVLCADYGVPQNRRRHVLLASRIKDISLITPTHLDKHLTVGDVISHLPAIKAGEQDKRDPLHRSSALNKVNLQRIKSSKPGGTWEDWPDDLKLACHKRATGRSYSGVYGRMEWDKPAPTITTQCFGYGNGRFGHPEQNRAISLREAALLQGFREDYLFFHHENGQGKYSMKDVGKMIGNAVPVSLGKAIGLSFQNNISP